MDEPSAEAALRSSSIVGEVCLYSVDRGAERKGGVG